MDIETRDKIVELAHTIARYAVEANIHYDDNLAQNKAIANRDAAFIELGRMLNKETVDKH